MNKLQMILTAKIASAEGAHRTMQVAERYGQAAYQQGRRDAFREALSDVTHAASTIVFEQAAAPAPTVETEDADDCDSESVEA